MSATQAVSIVAQPVVTDSQRSSAEQFWKQALVCGLCSKKLDVTAEPKLLGCLHTVCKSCTAVDVSGKWSAHFLKKEIQYINP